MSGEQCSLLYVAAKYKKHYFRNVTGDELYMQRCIELALNGAGAVSPNPLVGAVVVHNGTIIGEGWHKSYGGPHAEVNAIEAVRDKSLLPQSTLYVNLEPCSHQGKTPPCADLIIRHQLKKVVIGMVDPFEKVAGSGIKKLQEAGIDVEANILRSACEELNRRFVTFVLRKRPYILLKWAQTADGFIAPKTTAISAAEYESRRHITGPIVQKLVHKWRAEEDAILVGTHTALADNPSLDVRAWKGRSPIRISIDRRLQFLTTLHILDGSAKTVIFTETKQSQEGNTTFIPIDFTRDISHQIIQHLYDLRIQSLIVEGGTRTLETFIRQGVWDEAQVFISQKILHEGVKAPLFTGTLTQQYMIDGNQLHVYRR
jgi:diaminohydroxyphosphoribosylaminopyrimidine deaminase/5-amino-6-(5-phosphoribosylamino)uracil reductase